MCNIGYTLKIIHVSPSPDFFPFGEGAGDSSNPVTDDENAVTLILDTPVVFYNSRQTEVYVSIIIYIKCIMMVDPHNYNEAGATLIPIHPSTHITRLQNGPLLRGIHVVSSVHLKVDFPRLCICKIYHKPTK